MDALQRRHRCLVSSDGHTSWGRLVGRFGNTHALRRWCGVPWPRRSGILSREESRGLTIEEVRQAVQNRMTEAIYARAQTLDPDIPAILTGHVTVNGATVGTERSMMLGQDHVLLAGDIGRPQVDYVALGHIHKHQILRNENPFMAYSGSLQRVDFSEEGDDKGFCVVNLDPAAKRAKREASG